MLSIRNMRLLALLACPFAIQAAAIGNAGKQKRASTFPEPKYFLEAESQHAFHYDIRYYTRALSTLRKKEVLRDLIRSYLTTFDTMGIDTWLMHGTLLGWWWGQKLMPWDYDADFQITEADMYYLAAYHNMSTYYYKHEGEKDEKDGRLYLLDINPHYNNRNPEDQLNLIDARWIDTRNGLYIDITAARYYKDHPRGDGIMYDKNAHIYRDTYVFPLRNTTFEGVPAKIPYKYQDMLESEYGEDALSKTKLDNGYQFNNEEMQWVAVDPDNTW